MGNKRVIELASLSLICAFLLNFILPLKIAYGVENSSDSKVVEEKLKGIISEYGEENIIFEDGISIKIGESIDLKEINPEGSIKWNARDKEIIALSDKLTGKSGGTTFLIGNSADKNYVREVYVYGNENNISFYRNSPRNNYMVYLDPGHGGYDPGARGNGIVEKELVLNLGNRIKSKLEREGIQVVMSRTGDEFVSLADRSAGANSENPDLFVSIHGNSASSSAAMGIETFYYKNMDKPLAQDLQNKLISYTGAVNRGAKYENFHVIRETKMPASLVEIGFLSNAFEASKLKNYEYQEKIVNSIVDGIKGYIYDNNPLVANRIYGINRYETSYEIFNKGWESSEYAVLASGVDYPDALCAAPLASKYNAPIVLAENRSLNNQSSLLKLLKSKGVKHVFLVGGTGVIPASFKNELLAQGITSKRLGGKNRYETSIEIAKEVGHESGEIAIANAWGFADGLSISSIAAKRNMPIILTPQNNIPDKVAEYINSLGIRRTFVIGASGVVSDSVAGKLPNVERLGGQHRYATNKAVFDRFKNDLDQGNLYIASAVDFPDALSVSALAGKESAFVVLSNLRRAEADVKNIITSNRPYLKNIYVLGSNALIGDNVLYDLSINFIR